MSLIINSEKNTTFFDINSVETNFICIIKRKSKKYKYILICKYNCKYIKTLGFNMTFSKYSYFENNAYLYDKGKYCIYFYSLGKDYIQKQIGINNCFYERGYLYTYNITKYLYNIYSLYKYLLSLYSSNYKSYTNNYTNRNFRILQIKKFNCMRYYKLYKYIICAYNRGAKYSRAAHITPPRI